MADTGRIRARWILGGSMACAAVLNLLATVRGPGLSPDSVTYLSTGINLANSRGLTGLAGSPLTLFPPAMPIVAATGEVLGLSAQTTARVFTTACFVVIVLLTHVLLRRVVAEPVVLYGGTLLVGVSPVLLGVSAMAWTESPFVVLSLLFLLLLGRVWEQRHATPLELIGLAALCWLAFMFRYAGVSLIASGVVILFVALRAWGAPRALLRVAFFAVLAASWPIAWMLRNHSIDGTYLGPRTDSPDTVLLVAKRLAGTFGDWIVPVEELPDAVSRVIGVLIGAVMLWILAVAWRRSAQMGRSGESSAVGVRSPYFLSAGLFLFVYVTYLAAAQLTSAFDPINSRLLSPVYVPVLLISAVVVEHLLVGLQARHRRYVLPAALVLALFLLGQSTAAVRDVRAGIIGGVGYNSRSWVESDLAASVAGLADSLDAVVYTDNPPGLWAATGLQPIFKAPARAGVRGLMTEGELETFAAQVGCSASGVYLALYENGDDRVFTAEEIETAVDLRVVERLDDGVLYAVSPLAAGGGKLCAFDGP